jgi:hypothetical protein
LHFFGVLMEFISKPYRDSRMDFHRAVCTVASHYADHLVKVYGEVETSLEIKTKAKGRTCNGGNGQIFILEDYIDRNEKWSAPNTYQEYKAFRNDPVIGNVVGKKSLRLGAIIAHEIAHWYHHARRETDHGMYWYRDRSLRQGKHRPHGDVWREMYAELRINFINPFV